MERETWVGDEAKVAEEYWRTHREGGGTDNDLRCFIQGWVACAAQPRAWAGDGFGPLSDDPTAHAHRAALNGVLDAARALADCNLPGGAPLGMFNRLIGAFTLYDHVRLGHAHVSRCPRCASKIPGERGAVSGANGRFAGACSDDFHGNAPHPEDSPAEAAIRRAASAKAWSWRESFPPTHYCRECKALWRHWPDGSWSLVTMNCGKCCDNVPMGEQIVALADSALSPDQRAVAEELAHLGKCAVALDAAMGRADPWAKPERDAFQAALKAFGHLMIDRAMRKRLAREGGA